MDIHRPPDIVVVAGGAPIAPELVAALPGAARVIAADSGVERCHDLGWTVDVAVGDFDSLDPELVDRLERIADDVRRFPTDKDATDLELALDVAAESGPVGDSPVRLMVAGLEGGRPDHALANLLVAASERYSAVEIELVLDQARAWVVRRSLVGHLDPGTVLSVVPVHGAATVSITGVRWPLDHAVLAAGSTRGVSNEAAGGPVQLSVHAGTVLCITPRSVEEDQ